MNGMISPRDGRNAEACGDLAGYTPVAPIERRQACAHAIGKLAGCCGRLAGHEDHEFLTAKARHQRILGRISPEQIGKTDENDISGRMTVNIVDTLEVIYIAGDDRTLRRIVAKIGNSAVEAAPVQHVRQRIMLCRMQMPVDGDGNLTRKHGKRQQKPKMLAASCM